MFSKMGRDEGASGPGLMFASALKMMGLNPEIIEAISKGLLMDLKTVVGQQAEILARLEYTLKCSEALDPAFSDAWLEYLETRRREWAAIHGGISDGRSDRDAGDAGAGSGPAHSG